MNPMLQSLTANQASNVRMMFDNVRSAMNPMLMAQKAISQNPMMNQVMQCVQQYGGNPQTAFNTLAQQMGLDPRAAITDVARQLGVDPNTIY